MEQRTLFPLVLLIFLRHCMVCWAPDPADAYLRTPQLSQAMWEAANGGMGLRGIQEKYDTIGTFSSHIPDWPKLTKELAEKTGKQFAEFTTALTQLREAIELHYNNVSDNDTNIPPCCNVTGTFYNKDFKTYVDSHRICKRKSKEAGSGENLPGRSFLDQSRENYQNNHLIKWQYYGTEEGYLRLYPAFNINCTYEPRYRPWYVETFAAEPKDIVIVVDATSTSGNGTSNYGTELVREAVHTIIDTTNPNDRIMVVRFSDQVETPSGNKKTSTCYKDRLALATPLNKGYLNSFVDEPSKENVAAIYKTGFEKAFSLFEESDKTTQKRRKVLLFFTQSDPKDPLPGAPLMQMVHDETQNRKDRRKAPVTILTYGTGLKPSTVKLLQEVSNISNGNYTELSKKGLRSTLSSYYKTLSKPVNHSLYVLLYVDNWGLGLVISICQPFFAQTKFKGVVCLDGILKDLLSEVTNIQHGVVAYSFIIDNQGRTIQHPFLAQPTEKTETNLYIHISMLEHSSGSEIYDVLTDILSKQSGERSLRVSLPSAKTTFPGHWVDTYHTIKRYQWTKIPYTMYTLCIVSTSQDVQLNFSLPSYVNSYYITPKDITDNNPCLHEGLLSTAEMSIVSFDEVAFHKDCRSDLFVRKPGRCFKDYVSGEIGLSGYADSVWKSEESRNYNNVILWRHLVTLGGVRRIYPGVNTTLPKVGTLPWYVKALSDTSRLILTRGRARGRATIIMSHVVFEGRRSAMHTQHNIPVAVVAAEFRYSYFMATLNDIFPSCQLEQNSCFLVDESGLVLLHTAFSETNPDKLGHIIDMEPTVASYLISHGFLVSGNCTNVEHLRLQTFWKISPPGVLGLVKGPLFTLQSVPHTNTFLVIKEGQAQNGVTCSMCMTSGDIHNCSRHGQNTDCNCPCYSELQFDYCNYTFASSEPYTCPLSVRPSAIEKNDIGLPWLQVQRCFNIKNCRTAKTQGECRLLPNCSWCLDPDVDEHLCSSTIHCMTTKKSTSKVLAVVIIVILLILAIILIASAFILYCKGYRWIGFPTKPLGKCWRKQEEEIYNQIEGNSPEMPSISHQNPPTLPKVNAPAVADEGYINKAFDAGSLENENTPSRNIYSGAESPEMQKEPLEALPPQGEERVPMTEESNSNVGAHGGPLENYHKQAPPPIPTWPEKPPSTMQKVNSSGAIQGTSSENHESEFPPKDDLDIKHLPRAMSVNEDDSATIGMEIDTSSGLHSEVSSRPPPVLDRDRASESTDELGFDAIQKGPNERIQSHPLSEMVEADYANKDAFPHLSDSNLQLTLSLPEAQPQGRYPYVAEPLSDFSIPDLQRQEPEGQDERSLYRPRASLISNNHDSGLDSNSSQTDLKKVV